MKKELEISAKFDTSDFDRAVETMQRKLKDIYAPSDMVRAQQQTQQRLQGVGMGGSMSQPTQDAYVRSTQQGRRELDQLIREQAVGQEKLGKLVAQRTEKLEKLKEQQNQITKGSKEELDIKEKIVRVEENLMRQRQSYLSRNEALNKAIDSKNKPPGSETPMGPLSSGPGGHIGRTLAAIGTLATIVPALYKDITAAPIRSEASYGNAMQGTVGRDVGTVYGRRSAFESMYTRERSIAAKQAMEKMDSDRTADKMSLGLNAGLVAGGAAGGISTSFTGIGALLGLGAVGKGLHGMFGNERSRSLAFSGYSNNSKNRYESILAEDAAKNYQTSLEGQKNQNPYKTAAIGEYEGNFMRNLGAQRMMGLGNQGFYGKGGFMSGATSNGFTPEMSLDMAQSIQGSGGSTRAMRGATFGNQLSRSMDLTNAGQVLGTLSGGVGSNEATKQATVKILAEGMKLGLDDSNFREENRRFTQAVAEVVARSGAQGQSDFDRTASGFSRFVNENTNKGIDAAKGAYDQYQEISSSVTGPRGVMRAAGFMKDPNLSKLSTMQKQALMQVPEEQLNESNILVQGAANELGISAGELIKSVRGVNEGAVSRYSEADQIRDRLRGKGVDLSNLTAEKYKNLPDDVKKDVYNLQSIQTTEFGNKDSRQSASFLGATVGRPPGPWAGDQSAMNRINGDSGRMEDNTIRAMAGDASTVLKNFNEMRGEMNSAAESAAMFTHQVREMNAALIKALESGNKQAYSDVVNKYLQDNAKKSQTQTQSAKPAR